MNGRLEELRAAKAKTLLGGGRERIDRQHKAGKLTARERIDLLLDSGSFQEWNMLLGHAHGLPAEGVVTGAGMIHGRPVCVFSQDATVAGGSMSHWHGFKVHRTIERAIEMRVPLIGLFDSPGARVERPDDGGNAGVVPNSDKHEASVFYPNTQASGVIPQISAILGSCAGTAAYSPALTDFIFMVDGISHLFITGPRIVKSTLGEEIGLEELGGARVHTRVSGVADLRFKNEQECFIGLRRLLSFLPQNNQELSPLSDTGDDPDRLDEGLASIIPESPSRAYDVRKVITRLADKGDFFEIKPEFAGEIVVGFSRLGGHSVGFIANQPMIRAGSLTVDSSDKEARFIRFCDAFNIPLILLIDTPAYMPGSAQEHRGIIRHGAKVLYALCESTVPRIGLILRKSYGGGNLGMGITPGMKVDFTFYWPSAEAGILGAQQSVDLFYADEIAKAEDKEAFRAEMVRQYRERYANPIINASGNLYAEDVIDPAETRRILIRSLQFLRTKSRNLTVFKRHGNMPM
ncbi:MAG: acyl-CoA carboxylase subunit beta [Deltaproteobacteria bacterium]|nr:acyl-CoA carboxylase subunit beta [Deltaproteobacteria bacterium]